jgi:Raf kinase inhibitor-like YbhB/YbcL family protein
MNLQFQISSPAFKEGEIIPKKYSSDGENLSPPFEIVQVPGGTKSLALICDDADAPNGPFTHWMVKNICPKINKIEENTNPGEEVTNSWKKASWGGPSPPSGTHRYYFKLFALSVDKLEAKTLSEFHSQCEKYKIGAAQIMGKYSKIK